MKAASFIKIAFFINKSKRDLRVKVCCATVEVLHRTSTVGRSKAEENDGEFHWYVYPRTPFCHYVAFPLKGKREIQRRFPFAAPPNCGRKGGTQYQRGGR